MTKQSSLVIVEMACKFPGADNTEEFWDCLIEQKNLFQSDSFSRTQFNIDDSIGTKTRSEISDIFQFESDGFSLTEEELVYTDPQQRILLELVQQLFRNVNFTKSDKNRDIGVFVGVGHNSYTDSLNARFFEESFLKRIKDHNILASFSRSEQRIILNELETQLSPRPSQSNMIAGNLLNLIPNRVSHEFDLRGPSIALETACSSSLVAFHSACQSILNGECKSAIAAGVQVNLTPLVNLYMEESGAISPKGELVAFDENSDGIVLGEGVGAVLIKKYEDAKKSGDNILCTIKATGVNNDGRSMGILAPSLKGQVELIKKVYKKENIDPQSIYAIEAHGTGTRIGDSVEINTLKSIFKKRSNPLYITSVKSNIGHLLASAGIASIIKTILCLNNNLIPANKGLKHVPKKWEIEKFNFNILKENKKIEEIDDILIGINSFGFGGTNSHCLLSNENMFIVPKKNFVNSIKRANYQFNPPLLKLKITKPRYFPVQKKYTNWKISEKMTVFSFDIKENLLLHSESWNIINAINNQGYNRSINRSVAFYFNNSTDDPDQILEYILFIRDTMQDPMIEHSYLILESIVDTGFGKLIQTLFTGLNQELPKIKFGILATDNDLESFQKANEILQFEFVDHLVVKKGQVVNMVLDSVDVENASIKPTKPGYTLVVSGSSGIGFEMCLGLSGKAGRIISLGRSSRKDILNKLKKHKLKQDDVEYFELDFLDRRQVVELAQEFKKKNYVFSKCIFTLGNTVVPGSLFTKDKKSIRSHLTSKIIGLKHIRILFSLLDQDPDIYLFSSTSAINSYEQRGIVDYAMANSYLEGAALENGYHVIFWGPWKNVGQSRILANDEKSITVEKALECWDKISSMDIPSSIVQVGNDSTKIIRISNGEDNRENPKVIKHSSRKSRTVDKTLTYDSNKLKELLLSEIEIIIGDKLTSSDFEEPLENLGIDSLDAVDLSNKLESQYGFKLDATIFFEFNTISKIIEYLLRQEPAKKITLLPNQKNFLTSHLLAPDKPNNIILQFEFKKGIEAKPLQDAINSVINSIPELKLGFKLGKDHEPYGVVKDFQYKVATSEFSRESNSTQNLKSILNQNFPTLEEPLLRIHLVEKEGKAKTLLLSCHHILLDGWSMLKIFDDILKQLDNPLNEEKLTRQLQLPDYARNLENLKNTERNFEFWKNKLKAYRNFEFPKDKSGPSKIGFIQTKVSEPLVNKLESITSTYNCSIFDLLLSCYFLTIHNLLNVNDLVIGTANLNRPRKIKGAFEQIGCLANSIPIRVELNNINTYSSLISKVKNELKQAYYHSNIDGGMINKLSRENKSNPNSRLSPFGISYNDLDRKSSYKEFLKNITTATTLSFVELTLICTRFSNVIDLSWSFNEGNLSDNTIRKFSQTFVITLMEITSLENLNETISLNENSVVELPSIELFSDQLLVHNKFFRAAEIFSENVAIEQDDEKLKYKDLKSIVNETTDFIKEHSNSNSLIGLLGFPSISSVISILSILNSGSAYLPLDPSWPSFRTKQIINDSCVSTLVFDSSNLDIIKKIDFSETEIQTIISVHKDDIRIYYKKEIGKTKRESSNTYQTRPSDTAYVMYTSGTTGFPKGVMVTHESLSIFLNWLQEDFKFSEKDRFIATSSLGFGGSLRQLFSTLLTGGTYLPVKPKTLQDPAELLKFLIQKKITILNTVPAIWENLAVRCIEDGIAPQQLRLMLIGGEKMSTRGLQDWHKSGLNAKIYNMYGSTETVVNATYFDTDELRKKDFDHIPIGKTRKGVVVKIIDEKFNECPIGCEGKILVGGPGISVGYLNDAPLTKEKYIKIDKTVFYDTGDYGIQDINRIFHFVGRKDDQIKIFGNRIDPNEIEQCISYIKGIKNNKVIRVDYMEAKYIVVFVITEREMVNVHKEVVSRIKNDLPGYMVPHYVFKIEELPLNQAKKINTSELRRIAVEIIQNKITSKKSPNSNIKDIIKEKWTEIFKTEEISIDDDFFAIGGDSLNAYLLSVLLQESLGFSIHPHLIYRFPTIRALSRQFQNADSSEIYKSVNPKRITSSEKGFLLLQKISSKTPLCCARIKLIDDLDLSILNKAFNLTIDKHPILRSIFVQNGKDISLENVPSHEYLIDHNIYSGEVDFKIHIDHKFQEYKNYNFQFDVWPLFKLSIEENYTGEKHLLAAIHHIIIDGWSLEVLVDEINTNYYSLVTKESVNHLTTTEEYMKARAKIIQREENLKSESKVFWQNKLSGISFKNIEPINQNKKSEHINYKISSLETRQLRDIAKKNQTSLFIVTLWIWLKALEKINNNNGFLVGIAQSGREILGLKGGDLIGCFATGIPFPYKRQDKEYNNFREEVKIISNDLSLCIEHNPYSLRTLSKINSANSGFSISNFDYYISFQDKDSLKSIKGPSIMKKEDSEYYFRAETGASKLMASVVVEDELSIDLLGYSPKEIKNKVEKQIGQLINELLVDFNAGNNIDSALVAYLPSKKTLNQIPRPLLNPILKWLNNLQTPFLLEITRTKFGKSGLIIIPIFADQLMKKPIEEVKESVLKGISIASEQGAKTVSLAGNLPTLLNYGYNLKEELKDENITLTTGHATTVVAVTLNTLKALEISQSKFTKSNVAIVGFGSIGRASLEMLLRKEGRPKSLCVFELATRLKSIQNEVKKIEKQYNIEIELFDVSKEKVSDPIYKNDLIIVAATTPEILEVSKFFPGTIMVDDSFPGAVNQEEAIHRMDSQNDVFLIGGGKIDLFEKESEIFNLHLPKKVQQKLITALSEFGFPGCRVESILISSNTNLPATIGLVDIQSVELFYQHCLEFGLEAKTLSLGNYSLNKKTILNVRKLRNR